MVWCTVVSVGHLTELGIAFEKQHHQTVKKHYYILTTKVYEFKYKYVAVIFKIPRTRPCIKYFCKF